MSSKVKRKVTVENTKDSDDQPRRPSVFERLGPGAGNIAAPPPERSSRTKPVEKCLQYLKTGVCSYGSACRYKHESFSHASSSRRSSKHERDTETKESRRKSKSSKRDDPKDTRTDSASPKRKSSKRSSSHSRKSDHDGKIKSTVVVSKPSNPDAPEPKKKGDGNWEEDSEDWPIDAAQLDYKEELTLERRRQQLQRELELELQKERLLNESVTITKTVSFSESSSTSSSSDSGSISSSSDSTSSSSEDDSSTSSSSSSSSGSSHVKKRTKRAAKEPAKPPKDDYDRIKSSRAPKVAKRAPSPSVEPRKGSRRGKRSPVSPKKRHGRSESGSRSNVRLKGPRTPSPVPLSRKQRQWNQSSSADSRSAEVHRGGRGKRHKKKKDLPRGDRIKSGRALAPPHLSSPNRTALLPHGASKKSKSRDEGRSKSRQRHRDASPPLLPRTATAPPAKPPGSRYPADDKTRIEDRLRMHARRDSDDLLPVVHKRTESRDRKRSKQSPPRKESRRDSLSPAEPPRGKGRRASVSPRPDRRKELDKKRDASPRDHESRRDAPYRGEGHGRSSDAKGKRYASPEGKKGREEKSGRDHAKDRSVEYESGAWQADHRKSGTSSSGRRTPEPRGRQEIRAQPSSRGDRSRERDQDRKKSGKKRDHSVRSVDDPERGRLVVSPPRRSQSPIHGHHAVREIESLTGNRGRIYDSDIPPVEPDYAYSYGAIHDPYLTDRLLPSEYESDVLRGPPVYPAEVYPEPRYRRGGKDSIDRYEPRDVISPRDVLPHRDIISLTGRTEDYLSDLPIDERSYDDRWPRGRARDDWVDTYAAIPPDPLPPHVAAALDEDRDRYGMPRRRRASPDWQRGRLEDRDSLNSGHRSSSRAQGPPREGRSRSPPKGPGSSRGSWSDRGSRHESRGGESRQHDDSQKISDERKGRSARKDRGKPKEEPADDKGSTKEKAAVKRPHSKSPSPAVKSKKRRSDRALTSELLKYHGDNSDKASTSLSKKNNKEESKGESKAASSTKSQKSSKQGTVSPKPDSLPSEKSEAPTKSSTDGKSKEKEDKKTRKLVRVTDDGTKGEDDFSDWSDDDDDLLTREDYVESEGNSESNKGKNRTADEPTDEGSSGSARRRDKHSSKDVQTHESKRDKSSSSRTSSKDRSSETVSHSKDNKSSDSKETDTQESFSLKDDTATDVDEYITAESVDYDPISDDELDALIEEPDTSIITPAVEKEKSKIVDALDVDWSALMSDSKPQFKAGSARQRFKPCHVLSRIGFSQALAGPELTKKIVDVCQKQLDEENEDDAAEGTKKHPKEFVMEHPLAAFHASITQNKKERMNLFSKVGPNRRALCARRDLQIRNLLCKPINKLAAPSTGTYTPQYAVVDKELYKQSLELLKLKKPAQPQTVDVC